VQPEHLSIARVTLAGQCRSDGDASDVPQRAMHALREIGVASGISAHSVGLGVSRRRSGVGAGSRRGLSSSVRTAGIAPVSEVLVNEVENSVTGLIRAWSAGDDVAGDRLFARVYAELRTIARRLHRPTALRGDDTLDTTALVHEVYLRLAAAGELRVENRAHFFAIAVRASRQIISNYARDAAAQKRGGSAVVEPLDSPAGQQIAAGGGADDLAERVSALEAALLQLETLHPRPCRVVECRYFGGLSIADTAMALNISEATVKRDWSVAQAWLHRALREPGYGR
jgi:RNA polymerase sigma factor (TIGR02999 family)